MSEIHQCTRTPKTPRGNIRKEKLLENLLENLHSTLVPAVGPGQTPRLELHLLESPRALKKKDKVTELKDNPKDAPVAGRGADEEFVGLVSSSNDVLTNLPRCQSTP